MNEQLFVVDAFTAEPFRGNPAGVCLLDGPADPRWMQAIAAEVGAPETAFVRQAEGRQGPDFDLRWFTPAVEVSLCGHATLAATHVLWSTDRVPDGAAICFRTASGELRASRALDGWIELDLPALPVGATVVPPDARSAVGVDVLAAAERDDWLVLEVGSEEDVEGVVPDFVAIGALQPHAVLVTAKSSGTPADFVSRVFAPNEGIDEDPVTGSAHCVLGPYWAPRLGRDELVGRQLSGRGGTVRVRVAGDRVMLGGQAVTIFRGTVETA